MVTRSVCLVGEAFLSTAYSKWNHLPHMSGFSVRLYRPRAGRILFKVRHRVRPTQTRYKLVTASRSDFAQDNDEQIPFAYRLYKRTGQTGFNSQPATNKLSAPSHHRFCWCVVCNAATLRVDRHFLMCLQGLLLASVGLLYGHNLPFFTTNNEGIRVFRHALIPGRSKNPPPPSISTILNTLLQHRAKFQPNVFPSQKSRRSVCPRRIQNMSAVQNAYLPRPCLEEATTQEPRPKSRSWRMTVGG